MRRCTYLDAILGYLTHGEEPVDFARYQYLQTDLLQRASKDLLSMIKLNEKPYLEEVEC